MYEALDLIHQWADHNVTDAYLVPWTHEVVTNLLDDDSKDATFISCDTVGRALFHELWEYI